MDLSKVLLFGCCLGFQHFGKFGTTAADEDAWDYGYKGPKTEAWCKKSEFCCSGSQQSPINLDLKLAKFGTATSFEFIDYDKFVFLNGLNNGHTAQFSQDRRRNRFKANPRIRGGGLNNTFVLHSFHFHWGKEDNSGSEHFDNGFQYPMELHLVHHRADFDSLGEAIESKQPNALAVLGVMYATNEGINNAIEDLTMSLDAIIYPESTVSLKKSLKLIDLLPFNKASMYRYYGSLTTPNCDEIVLWTVFSTPQYLSKDQMRRFRTLTDERGFRLVNNFRPLQDLGNRDLLRLEARGQLLDDDLIFLEHDSDEHSNHILWP